METVSSGPAQASSSDDRNLGFLNYALLFIAPFCAGLTALVAVIIAYVRRPEAEPLSRGHYDFQIKIFWVALVLAALAALALMVGVGFLISDLFNLATNQGRGWDAWQAAAFDGSDVRIHATTIMGMIVFVAASAASCLWIMIASIVGLARLAGGHGFGRA